MRRLAVLVTIAVLAVGCTPADDGTTTTSETTSTSLDQGTTTTPSITLAPDGYGGSLTIATNDFLGPLNPFAPDAGPSRLVGNAVWATIYDIEPDTWDRIPDAVTGLPSDLGTIEVDENGSMTVRYEVRSGAMWSDGVPITGDDIAFTAETMRDLALAGTAGVDPVMASVVAADGVEDLAFITFSEPNLAYEDALWIILPSHALADVDVAQSDGATWPSGGPFVVEDLDVPAGRLSLVRNEFYGRSDGVTGDLPYLDALTFVAIGGGGGPDSPSEALAVRDVDVAKLNNSVDELAAARAAAGATIASVPTPVIEQVTFQFAESRSEVNPSSSNDVLAYRTAVAHAINRPALLDETMVPWSPATPGLLIPLGGSAWDRYPYDPTLAAELLDPQADAGDGTVPASAVLTTTGNGDYRIRIGDALEASFEDVGIRYEPMYLDSVIFFGETLARGTFDLGMWAWLNDGGYGATVALAEQFDPTSEADLANVGGWNDPAATERYTEIIAELRTTADPERFEVLVTEAETILATELPVLPLFHRTDHVGWWPDTALGIVANGSRSDVTWNVETWQRAGE